ncbi:MAG: hypothetical protein ACERKJ_01840, partial [Candidatus Dadabacteria bacterium]
MIALKICKIEKKDAGKGFAKLDPGDMREIGVEPWDLIEIGGKRKTVVRVMPLDKSKTKKSIIELDEATIELRTIQIEAFKDNRVQITVDRGLDVEDRVIRRRIN